MRQTVGKHIRHAALHLGMAAYLLLFLGWAVPHHACEHTASDLYSSTQFADHPDHHASHNPDLCQLCQTHGQIDLVTNNPASIPLALTVSTVSCVSELSFESVHLSALASRAPPVLA